MGKGLKVSSTHVLVIFINFSTDTWFWKTLPTPLSWNYLRHVSWDCPDKMRIAVLLRDSVVRSVLCSSGWDIVTDMAVKRVLVIHWCREPWFFFFFWPILNVFLSLQHDPVIQYKDAHRGETRLKVGLLIWAVVFSVVRKKYSEAKAAHYSGCGDLDLRWHIGSIMMPWFPSGFNFIGFYISQNVVLSRNVEWC